MSCCSVLRRSLRMRMSFLLQTWAIVILAAWRRSRSSLHRGSLILVQRRKAGPVLLLLLHALDLALLAPRQHLACLLQLRQRLLRDLRLPRALPRLWPLLSSSLSVLLRPLMHMRLSVPLAG